MLKIMRKRKLTDQGRFTRNSRIAIYGRVFFWVFFTIISIEVVVLSASYLVHRNPDISIHEESLILFVFGSILSLIISFSLIWAIRLILGVYDRQKDINTDEEFALLNDLETALDRNELVILFQPQACLKTGNIIGMETLLRWEHKTRGTIMPSIFIPIAEKAGLIDMISEWTILQACIHTKKILDLGYDLRVAVNISQMQFKNPRIVEHVLRILRVTELPARNLELEITETAMMEDIEYALRIMMELREIGVLLAIDDFGMGYSSLSELDRLPVHKLKIDKAFVQTLNHENIESNIAYSIIQLGHQLNLQISVEGIETEAQRQFFAELQCHEAQGYYISAPIPAHLFPQYLANLSRNFST